MNTLVSHYNALYTSASEQITAGLYSIDNQIGATTDNRFGITLLIRPNELIRQRMLLFLEELKALEPDQYYYPASDMHVTVMSIISCYSGFKLEDIAVEEYVAVIEKSLAGVQAFEIDFSGVTASASAVMAQGFPSNNSLNILRNNLRLNFQNSGMQQSIDKRYAIVTAHITLMRFKDKLRNSTELLDTLDKYRNYNFGRCAVTEAELVYNDWYQRKAFVKPLHKFCLQ